jgi:hypothetical protein
MVDDSATSEFQNKGPVYHPVCCEVTKLEYFMKMKLTTYSMSFPVSTEPSDVVKNVTEILHFLRY